jgi:hypothetical protein
MTIEAEVVLTIGGDVRTKVERGIFTAFGDSTNGLNAQPVLATSSSYLYLPRHLPLLKPCRKTYNPEHIPYRSTKLELTYHTIKHHGVAKEGLAEGRSKLSSSVSC